MADAARAQVVLRSKFAERERGKRIPGTANGSCVVALTHEAGAMYKTEYNNDFEMWLSLVERCVRDAEAAGSNPVISTIKKG